VLEELQEEANIGSNFITLRTDFGTNNECTRDYLLSNKAACLAAYHLEI
jgi:hypothetical protein